jgi:hypothetical protein
VLGDAPGEEQVFEFAGGRRAFGDGFQVCLGDAACVAVLQEEAAGDGLGEDARGGGVGQAFGDQQAEVFLFRKDGLGGGVGARRDDDFGEDFGDDFCGLFVERAVQRDDAAEGGGGVAGERALVGVDDGGAEGDAAGVGVLDDGDGGDGIAELADQLIGGVGVVDVVVGEFLALQLARGGDARALLAGDVEGGLLVGVLAVAQGLLEAAAEGGPVRRGLAVLAGVPLRDGGVVGGGARVGLGGETAQVVWETSPSRSSSARTASTSDVSVQTATKA